MLRLIKEDNASLEIHINGLDVQLPVARVDLVTKVKGENDGTSEERHEESLSIGRRAIGSVERRVESGNKSNNVEEDAEIAAPNTEGSLVRNKVEIDALGLETRSHTGVSEADGAPNEEESKTGQSQKPVKDGTALLGLSDISQQTESKLNDDTVDGTTLAINVVQELGGMATHGHSLHGTGGTKGTRVGDGQDGDGDDGVEDGGQNLDACILNGEDERRGLCVGARSTEETLIIRTENGSNDEEVDDVEESNTPKDLLGSSGDRLSGVSSLSGGEANHFSTTKGKGGNGEDSAEALEVGESTRVVPVLGTEVALITDTTTVDDDTEDDESQASADLDGGQDEFDLSVTTNTKDLNNGESDEEDSDPNSLATKLAN
jgi:hypothetical protein